MTRLSSWFALVSNIHVYHLFPVHCIPINTSVLFSTNLVPTVAVNYAIVVITANVTVAVHKSAKEATVYMNSLPLDYFSLNHLMTA